jgi:hypothetical protein
MSGLTFWAESGQLCIADGLRILRRGDLDGADVLAVVQLKNSGTAVLLLDPEAGAKIPLGGLKGSANLVCVDSEARVRWRSASPGEQDWWISIQMVADTLSANTWSGFQVVIDPENGGHLSRTFVK